MLRALDKDRVVVETAMRLDVAVAGLPASCVCQSAPVRALVVPVCCERGLSFKNSSSKSAALDIKCSRLKLLRLTKIASW